MRTPKNVSIHEFIKQHVRRKIERENLAPGDQLPSENQLARQFEVSRSLARQALRELEIEGYITRSQGTRSRVAPPPDRSGVSIDNKKTRVLALSFLGVHSAYTRDIVDAFTRSAYEAGYHVLTHNLWLDKDEQCEFLRMLRRSGVAGMAVGLWQDTKSDSLRQVLGEFADTGFPVVQIDRYIPELEAIDYVVSDNVAIGEQLTASLLAKGYRRICFLQESSDASSIRGRLEGYCQALEKAGLEVDKSLIVSLDQTRHKGDSVPLRKVLALKQPPDAFLCIHEYLLSRLNDYMNHRGHNLAREYGIAVADDSELSARLGLPAVIAVQAAEEIGARGVQCLLARISTPTLPPQHHQVKAVISSPLANASGALPNINVSPSMDSNDR